MLGAKNNKAGARFGVSFCFSCARDGADFVAFGSTPRSGGSSLRKCIRGFRRLGVQYHVGIDGLGLLMLLLSAIVVSDGDRPRRGRFKRSVRFTSRSS